MAIRPDCVKRRNHIIATGEVIRAAAMLEHKSGAGVSCCRSESKSGAHLRHHGYEQDVASDSSDLWSDESGESGADEVTAGGADEVAAGGGLPAGGLGVVMQLG